MSSLVVLNQTIHSLDNQTCIEFDLNVMKFVVKSGFCSQYLPYDIEYMELACQEALDVINNTNTSSITNVYRFVCDILGVPLNPTNYNDDGYLVEFE